MTTPYYDQHGATLYVGDVIAVLKTLPDGCVQTCVTSPPYWALRSYLPDDHADKSLELGSEPTPDAYVAKMVEVFAEVKRVLRDDGCIFVNLGDSYANGSNNKPHTGILKTQAHHQDAMDRCIQQRQLPPGLKPKDLVGIPWRVALALQADGWYLRSDIIWHKPNPMPESCTDRPTKAHEYVFLLSKRPRYFFDNDAVREPVDRPELIDQKRNMGQIGTASGIAKGRGQGGHYANPAGRNIRTVWTIATQAYPHCHFATYPEKLVTPCVKAGTSERGCCPACGAGWVRVVERVKRPAVEPSGLDRFGTGDAGVHRKVGQAYQNWKDANPDITTGWSPGCECDAGEPVPCVVLDPFAGSFTTGAVAVKLGRRAIGIELSETYAALAVRRIEAAVESVGLFAQGASDND